MASDCDGCWFELWVEERRAKGDGAGSDGGLQPLGGDGFLFPMPLLSTGQYWAGGTGYLPDVFQLTRPATLHSLSLSCSLSLLSPPSLSSLSLLSLFPLAPPPSSCQFKTVRQTWGQHGGGAVGGQNHRSKCSPKELFEQRARLRQSCFL